MNLFPVSFSRIQTFEQCERKYEFLYALRTVADPGNEYTDYGNRVHKAIEEYAKGEAGVTPDMAKFKPLVDRVLAAPGTKLFEQRMAVGWENTPVAWDSDQCYVRGIADVLTIDGKRARALDWKTGKPREDDRQLKLLALLTFAHHPEVERVDTAYVWLHHDKVTRGTYAREQCDDLWEVFDAKIGAMAEAVELGVFKARPSPLCNWCAAKEICPDRR